MLEYGVPKEISNVMEECIITKFTGTAVDKYQLIELWNILSYEI